MFCLTTFTLCPKGLHWGKNYAPVRSAIFLQERNEHFCNLVPFRPPHSVSVVWECEGGNLVNICGVLHWHGDWPLIGREWSRDLNPSFSLVGTRPPHPGIVISIRVYAMVFVCLGLWRQVESPEERRVLEEAEYWGIVFFFFASSMKNLRTFKCFSFFHGKLTFWHNAFSLLLGSVVNPFYVFRVDNLTRGGNVSELCFLLNFANCIISLVGSGEERERIEDEVRGAERREWFVICQDVGCRNI